MSLRSDLVTALLAVFPKRNTAVVHTWPAFDDTAQALMPELERSRLDRIYYLAAGSLPSGGAPRWGTQVEILPKRSWRAFWFFLTSRFIFFTHQCFTSRFPRNVESVNLWHGMPIKRIGWMSGQHDHAPHSKYELATSDFWVPIIQACMKPWGRVLVNGLPRYDRFSALGREGVRARLGGSAASCAKLVVWLPTYRRTVVGAAWADGRDFQNEAQVPGFDADRFEAWLTARNMVCVLKPHPLGPPPKLRTKGNLRVLDEAALAEQGLTLYSLLGGADALLTDVSSVYIDFLILDRPIVHAFADRSEYQGSRGFTFDWKDEFLAGPLATDMGAVEQALDEIAAGRDGCAARRAHLRALFHAKFNGPATPALLAQLGLGSVSSNR